MAKTKMETKDGVVELTDKEMNFCVYYAQSFNATRSYMQAFGNKYEVAAVQASKLIKKAKIRSAIEEIKSANAQANMLKMDDIVNGFMEIAFNKEESAKDRMRAMEWLSNNIGLASEEQKARIAKLKAETKRLEEDKVIGAGVVMFAGEGDLID